MLPMPSFAMAMRLLAKSSGAMSRVRDWNVWFQRSIQAWKG
jgi:hypothetical protein